jgi:hypothetical protein
LVVDTVKFFAVRTYHFVLLPTSFIVASIKEYLLSQAISLELRMLSKVYLSIWVEHAADIAGYAIFKRALKNDHRWEVKLASNSLEEVVFEFTFVDASIRHDHSTFVSEIIFPQTFKIATISPVHGSKSLSLTA